MQNILVKVLPVISIFIVGYILRRINLFRKEDGDLFLKVVFYIAAPCFILLSVSKITLDWKLIFLPVIPIVNVIIVYFISMFFAKKFNFQAGTFGVFLVASMIMNTGFTLPFFIAVYGNDGLARISFFDMGTACIVYSFAYYIACKYGSNPRQVLVKKILVSPPLWALLIAIFLNVSHYSLPAVDFFQALGNLTSPLIMLALGIYFDFKFIKPAPLATILILRMGIGLLLGIIFVKLLNLEGLNKIVVLVGSSAPVGYNTVVFSSLEQLDKEFAVSVVSISILLGLITVPLLMYLL